MYDKDIIGHTSMLMFILIVRIDELYNCQVNKWINKCFVIYNNVMFPNRVPIYISFNLVHQLFPRNDFFFMYTTVSCFNIFHNLLALFIILSENTVNQLKLAPLVILSFDIISSLGAFALNCMCIIYRFHSNFDKS